MKNNKDNKLNKYFLYTFFCVCIFSVVLALSCFIAGDINVFEWDGFERFFTVLFSTVISVFVIGYHEIIGNK